MRTKLTRAVSASTPPQVAQPTAQQTSHPTESKDPGGSDSGESTDQPEPLSLDIVYDILKNERRRRVLRYLDESGGTATLSDLAVHLAAIENDKEEKLVSSKERKRLYVGLYQCHLPRMDSSGVVDFDSDRGTIETTAQFPELFEYLDVDEEADDDQFFWPGVYLGASGVATVILTTGALDVAPGGVAQSLTALAVVALFVVAAVHAFSERRVTES